MCQVSSTLQPQYLHPASAVSVTVLDCSAVEVNVEELVVHVLRLEDVVVKETLLLVLVVEISNSSRPSPSPKHGLDMNCYMGYIWVGYIYGG